MPASRGAAFVHSQGRQPLERGDMRFSSPGGAAVAFDIGVVRCVHSCAKLMEVHLGLGFDTSNRIHASTQTTNATATHTSIKRNGTMPVRAPLTRVTTMLVKPPTKEPKRHAMGVQVSTRSSTGSRPSFKR